MVNCCHVLKNECKWPKHWEQINYVNEVQSSLLVESMNLQVTWLPIPSWVPKMYNSNIPVNTASFPYQTGLQLLVCFVALKEGLRSHVSPPFPWSL